MQLVLLYQLLVSVGAILAATVGMNNHALGIFDYLLAGDSVKDFLEDFPTVSFEQIRYVLQSAEVAFEKVAA